MDTILGIYLIGWVFMAFGYSINDTEPSEIRIARFVFWPVFAVRGLRRSLKLAWKE